MLRLTRLQTHLGTRLTCACGGRWQPQQHRSATLLRSAPPLAHRFCSSRQAAAPAGGRASACACTGADSAAPPAGLVGSALPTRVGSERRAAAWAGPRAAAAAAARSMASAAGGGGAVAAGGSGDGVSDVGSVARSPSEVPEMLRKVLENKALVTLGDVFRKNGHEIRLAGGVVRDLMLDIEPHDIDLCTTATPEEMAGPDGLGGGFLNGAEGIDHVVPTGLQHGTITAVIDHEPYEITTLRIDTDHDGRHCEVQFTTDWKLDAARRDLTINAMMMDLNGVLYDYFGGREDLESHVVRFVGNPVQRLEEDYLRILRYYRFHGRINGTPEHDATCVEAIVAGAPGLERISGERIHSEMMKILSHPSLMTVLKAMSEHRVLEHIGLWPATVGGVHLTEMSRVEKHTPNPVTRLACLLDDAAEVEMVHKRWKLPKRELAHLHFVVKHRGRDCDLRWAKAATVNAELPVTKETVGEVLLYGARSEDAAALAAWDVPKCPVNGGDLIKAGFSRGPGLGAALTGLKDRWIESDYTLGKDELIAMLGKP